MPREFKEGYIYKLSGVSYEEPCEEDGSLVCSVITDHDFLAYGEGYDTFIISEEEEIEVIDGEVERLDNLKVGHEENDGVAKFVVIEGRCDGSYLVASLY